jgi:hypothetical protein
MRGKSVSHKKKLCMYVHAVTGSFIILPAPVLNQKNSFGMNSTCVCVCVRALPPMCDTNYSSQTISGHRDPSRYLLGWRMCTCRTVIRTVTTQNVYWWQSLSLIQHKCITITAGLHSDNGNCLWKFSTDMSHINTKFSSDMSHTSTLNLVVTCHTRQH